MSEAIKQKADAARKMLIPSKSSDRYRKEIDLFQNWQRVNKVENVDEDVILAYVSELSKKYEPSSVWTKLSMLKTMLLTNENIDISSYAVVKSFMKRNSAGHVPKQAKTFTMKQIKAFLLDASDDDFLPYKVATIFGIYGGCRREELYSLTVDAVVDAGTSLVVTLSKTKTGRSRMFTVVDGGGVKYLDIIRKYKNMRPQHISHNHFFVSCRNGKCTVQRIGINSFGDMGKKVAAFLKLPEPSLYTGHAFRRSSASLLADSGADISVLKRHGGWKSSSVAERYVEDSLEMKKKIAHMIQGTNNSDVSLNFQSTSSSSSSNTIKSASHCFGGVSFSNLQNCTFNLRFNGTEMPIKRSPNEENS